jgi:NAD(P)-dependent dehydrogenase (short-subunit alcohol dehydrogenase family)
MDLGIQYSLAKSTGRFLMRHLRRGIWREGIRANAVALRYVLFSLEALRVGW